MNTFVLNKQFECIATVKDTTDYKLQGEVLGERKNNVM